MILQKRQLETFAGARRQQKKSYGTLNVTVNFSEKIFIDSILFFSNTYLEKAFSLWTSIATRAN